MTVKAGYQLVQHGTWRIWGHDGLWNESVWRVVCEAMENQTWLRHPQTTRLKLEDDSKEVFLKTYFSAGPGAVFKDLFRVSKAVRHWQQSLALAGNGFLTPLVIAAGERRRFRKVEKAFILTQWLPAVSLSSYIRGLGSVSGPCLSPSEKRAHIRKLGYQVGRMHALGFVHGDLVLSNVLVEIQQHEASYYFIDHDRTRRYPPWFPQTLWRRNLVQLNRLVLPGITLSDRMRFFSAYVAARGKSHRRKSLQLLRWLAAKTRRRRSECDGVAGNVSFRELMRWDGPYGDKSGRR